MNDWRAIAWLSFAIIVSSMAWSFSTGEGHRERTKQVAYEQGYEEVREQHGRFHYTLMKKKN